MDATPLADAIAIVRRELTVCVADSKDLVRRANALRREAGILERNYEAGGFGTDEFEPRTRHVVLRRRTTGQVVGTVRLVLPSRSTAGCGLPIQLLGPRAALPPVPLATTAEISRFAISRDRNGIGAAAASLMRLALMQGIVRLSAEARLTHWVCVMERSLLRLFQSTAIHLQPVGPTVEHHGTRQPAYGHIGAILARMRREQDRTWDFITDGGRLWATAPSRPMVA